jgi:thioredoxin reductase
MQNTQVLVIGAGPYGISIAAHLRARGIDHVIAGKPMDSWTEHSPVGTYLKSEPYGSDPSAPRAGYDVRGWSEATGREYIDRIIPLSSSEFLGYADWFMRELAPDIRVDLVRSVTPAAGGFLVGFEGGDSLTARQVVVATGLPAYKYLPGELAGLPADLLSHSNDLHDLSGFAGRKVAVVGAGQSALETAALLHEKGAAVQIVARAPGLHWNRPNPDHVSRLGQVKWPVNKLCEGWRCQFYYTPAAFRRLPAELQATKGRTFLGASGAYWLKDRVDGVIDTLTGYQVKKADPSGDGIRLFLSGQRETVIEADHVVAGTGFRVNLARLGFLDQGMRAQVDTFKDYPVVSRVGESSVPGLYFAGAHTAANLGPSVRFIAGTHNVSRALARALQRRQ